MGSALQYYRKSLSDFRHEAFLVPDPARVAEYRALLDKMPGKKVGICWRSMMLGPSGRNITARWMPGARS